MSVLAAYEPEVDDLADDPAGWIRIAELLATDGWMYGLVRGFSGQPLALGYKPGLPPIQGEGDTASEATRRLYYEALAVSSQGAFH